MTSDITTQAQPTATFKKSQFSILTFDGKTVGGSDMEDTIADVQHFVYPPNSLGQPGFQVIASYPGERTVISDGILVTPGATIGIYSADCPILVLMDEKSGCGIAAHCGRPAMTRRQFLMRREYNIITAALDMMKQQGSKPTDLTAYITAGICQDCFTHDLHKACDMELLQSFPKAFIHSETGGLDLIGLITAELAQAGVLTRHISSDELCTKEHPGLVSKRAGKAPGEANLVIVHSH